MSEQRANTVLPTRITRHKETASCYGIDGRQYTAGLTRINKGPAGRGLCGCPEVAAAHSCPCVKEPCMETKYLKQRNAATQIIPSSTMNPDFEIDYKHKQNRGCRPTESRGEGYRTLELGRRPGRDSGGLAHIHTDSHVSISATKDRSTTPPTGHIPSGLKSIKRGTALENKRPGWEPAGTQAGYKMNEVLVPSLPARSYCKDGTEGP